MLVLALLIEYNKYKSSYDSLFEYRRLIIDQRNSLSGKISLLEKEIESEILSENNMPNDYYKKFQIKEKNCLDKAKQIVKSIAAILSEINKQIASLEEICNNLSKEIEKEKSQYCLQSCTIQRCKMM